MSSHTTNVIQFIYDSIPRSVNWENNNVAYLIGLLRGLIVHIRHLYQILEIFKHLKNLRY